MSFFFVYLVALAFTVWFVLHWLGLPVPGAFEGCRNLRKAVKENQGWNVSQVFDCHLKTNVRITCKNHIILHKSSKGVSSYDIFFLD